MFGYVTIAAGALTQEQRERYRAYYCGLCHALKHRYGALGRMTLSYDITFLYLLLSSLYEPDEIRGTARCLPHPFRPHAYVQSELCDYCCDMNLALAYHKCLDDWQDEKNWYKANPSLGHTITIDKVRDAYRKALETPADENMFRQLRLNQWVKQSVRWMPMDKWDECGGVVDPYVLEGRACYAGLDLSSTSDLTALMLAFPPTSEDEPYIALPFFWLPEETLSLRVRRDHVPYDQWAKRGFIQTTEGNVVHYGFIERFICELGERYNIREIAHDRWNATMMVQTLEDDGFTMVPFGQGFKDMSPPTKELMRLVLEHKLCHGGHPVLRWNMDNAYVRTDPAGNLKLDKEKSTEKVDGAVALVMALDRAMKNLNGGDSVYNHRGFLVL